MPTYKLHYFDLNARGEPIRALLSHSNADWEDVRLTFEQWPSVKPSMPNQQVPCLELNDGKKMGESTAILRYLGAKLGYYPSDPLKAFQCDECIEAAIEVYNEIYKPQFASDSEKPAVIEKIINVVMPKFLKGTDAYYAKGAFITGDKLCCADFMVGNIYVTYATNPASYAQDKWEKLMNDFPNFKAYGERYRAANVAWLDKRPVRPI